MILLRIRVGFADADTRSVPPGPVRRYETAPAFPSLERTIWSVSRCFRSGPRPTGASPTPKGPSHYFSATDGPGLRLDHLVLDRVIPALDHDRLVLSATLMRPDAVVEFDRKRQAA